MSCFPSISTTHWTPGRNDYVLESSLEFRWSHADQLRDELESSGLKSNGGSEWATNRVWIVGLHYPLSKQSEYNLITSNVVASVSKVKVIVVYNEAALSHVESWSYFAKGIWIADEGEQIITKIVEATHKLLVDDPAANILDTRNHWNVVISKILECPDILYTMSPRDFELLVAELLRRNGFDARVTKESHDDGVDVEACHRSILGETPFLIQCKRFSPSRPVTVSTVREMIGVADTKKAVTAIVTTSRFTSEARLLAGGPMSNKLSLIDFNDLVGWINATALNSSPTQWPSLANRSLIQPWKRASVR